MPYALALCALIAAHTIGADPILSWLSGRSSATLAAQAACHAGTFIGLAGVMLSLTNRGRLGVLPLIVGLIAVVCLLSEDVRGVLRTDMGSSKDLVDLGQRVGLVVLFFTRLDTVGKRIFA